MTALKAPRRRLFRTSAAAACAVGVLLAAGCTREPAAAPAKLPTCADVACVGVLNGARYEIRLPREWNGTLLLYSHEFRSADPFPPDFAKPSTAPEVAPNKQIAERLLTLGYALAGSAWSSNGLATREGVTAGEELHAFFRDQIAAPERVYVWGSSVGGTVSQLLAERHEWVSGAAPMCAALAGANPNFDLGLDISFAIKALLDPGVQITNYTSYAQAKAAWERMRRAVRTALAGGPESAGKVLLINALGNQLNKSENHDASTLDSRIAAAFELLDSVLAWTTVVRYDVERRVGGNPSTNETADYALRISSSERRGLETMAPGSLARNLAVLKAAPRITADEKARAALTALEHPTGKLRVPTITLHTAIDPVTITQNQSVFGARALRNESRTADLLQVYTVPPERYSGRAPYGVGHCNFTDDERIGILTSLDRWVRTGQRPSVLDLGIAMRGTSGKTGFDASFEPGRWPAEREIY